jgi:hypothetical protein
VVPCDAGQASMAYFYFDFKDADKQNRGHLLLSILAHLSAQSDQAYLAILFDLDEHVDGVQSQLDSSS